MASSNPLGGPSAGFLQSALDAVRHPVWVIGADGGVENVNESAVALLGYADRRAVIGRPSHDTLHHRHPDGSDYPAALCPVVSGRVAVDPYEWFLRRNGRALPVRWQTRSFAHETGTSLLLSFADASGEWELERVRRVGQRAELEAFAGENGTTSERAGVVEALLERIRDRAVDPSFSVAVLARESFLSTRTLQSLFAATGATPSRRIREARLERAVAELDAGATVTEAAVRAGFGDLGTFERSFRAAHGVTPRAYRAAP